MMDVKRKLLVATVATMPVLGVGGLAYASASGGSGQLGTTGVTSTSSPAEASSEVSGTETDGPGGHQDPQGANVDHQFQGQE